MRASDPKLALLSDVRLFAHLTRRQLREVASLLDVVEVETGRVLTREGERGLEFFVLLEGTASVRRNERELATLVAGDVFGEMALVDEVRRSATVVAATPLRLLVGERRAFATLLEADDDVRDAILQAAAIRERSNAA
ncbi:MAG: cyclic nucleotide-binding domain-containing protein [Actinobacteria bacterium]|nr:cyclic nucleotide-binding domain-containing protein [Actinomycetota bacterium]